MCFYVLSSAEGKLLNFFAEGREETQFSGVQVAAGGGKKWGEGKKLRRKREEHPRDEPATRRKDTQTGRSIGRQEACRTYKLFPSHRPHSTSLCKALLGEL